ncbi:MAG: UDP-2,3-diacylglucosamine diphosphatase [Betaproteobacteria bacterium]
MAEITEFTAPAHWRAVELVSDLHLCEATPRTLQAFVAYLTGTDADAVFILGDLFEVWVGDDQCARPSERTVVETLKSCARRRWLGFMHGNRDFLVGQGFAAAAGLHLLADPTCLSAFDARWLLTHGDALCLQDTEYQNFRGQVRSARWQEEFLRRTFDERWSIASGIRSQSRARKSAAPDPQLWADVDREAGLSWLAQARARTLIHGHTHRPGDEVWGEGRSRSVLSDWDLDHAPYRAEVVRLDVHGLSRRTPAVADARPTGLTPDQC